ncbi:MAG: ATP-binding protein [Hormoscilla sp. GUM202]|nr:ATP-binding protein [Hormoscilla sp. GUM202]
MVGNQTLALADNWAYLRLELSWLDRLLRIAVARQRQDVKEIDRVAKSKVDQATSHWWKGLISLEKQIGNDDKHQRQPNIPGLTNPPLPNSYQQQLEARIKASYARGIVLGLPSLRDRAALTLFEKNLVIISLAPEVNRRYGQLYGYLQGKEAESLPTVDLLFRLLCRNDTEWRDARTRLTSSSPLIELGLVELLDANAQTLLERRLKLDSRLVNYLLAASPDPQVLESLVLAKKQKLSSILEISSTPKHWSDLILPAEQLGSLQHISRQWELQSQVDVVWGMTGNESAGLVVLLTGLAGTGKTTAAQAIAHSLQKPLATTDLALLDKSAQKQVWAEIMATSPRVLLVKSAQEWLGRNGTLSATEINQFMHQRSKEHCITLLTVAQRQTVKPSIVRQLDRIIEFPLPQEDARLRLWQQAFPAQVPLDPEIDWQFLARRWRLSGGEIKDLARQAAFYAVAESPLTSVKTSHLLQAWEQKYQKPGQRRGRSC